MNLRHLLTLLSEDAVINAPDMDAAVRAAETISGLDADASLVARDGTSAVIVWRPADIETIRPDWSDGQREEAMAEIRNQMQDRSVEAGWEILDSLLPKAFTPLRLT